MSATVGKLHSQIPQKSNRENSPSATPIISRASKKINILGEKKNEQNS